MKWTAELMYIARNDLGVIVGIQEDKPLDYAENTKKSVEIPSRHPSNAQEKDRIKKIEQQIQEYSLMKRRRKVAK